MNNEGHLDRIICTSTAKRYGYRAELVPRLGIDDKGCFPSSSRSIRQNANLIGIETKWALNARLTKKSLPGETLVRVPPPSWCLLR